MTLDKNVVLLKLEQIQNCVERIESKLPFTLEELEGDFDLQDVVSVNLQRAIQVSVDLAGHLLTETNQRAPETMADAFRSLCRLTVLGPDLTDSLVKAIGLRNALVHEYDGIRWEVVHEVSHKHLGVFRDYARTIKSHYLK